MYPPSIQKLIDLFSKFPTVGPRTAARFVFYLLDLPQEKTEELAKSIYELKQNVKHCSFCFKTFQDDKELCEICSNPKRDKSLLCVVEKETDIAPIENTHKYLGRYFILGGLVSKFNKKEGLRADELLQRAGQEEIKETILAINSTAEGETTTLYLERLLNPLNKRITKLGRGLPVGGELEYADEETLSSALEGRK